MRAPGMALVVVLASCGGDDSGGPLTIDSLEDAVVDAYCNLYVRCGVVDDLSTCRGLDVDIEINADLRAAVDAGLVVFHADKASECLASFNGSTCDFRASALSSRNQSEACDQIFEGTVGEGGGCALDEECISQTCVTPTCAPDQCCQGACQGGTPPPPRPQLGESCATGSCVASYCDQVTMRCTALLADDSACTSNNQCESGACITQICRATAPPGGACSSTQPCRDLGTYCSMTSMTCVAYGLSGDTCAADTDCSPIYACNGTCELGPLVGDACGSNNRCIDRSYCDTTTMLCTAPKADGAACQNNNECTSGTCDGTSATCTTPPVCI